MILFIFWTCFFFFKQKTAYEMRISDWSSDVCSSDLDGRSVDNFAAAPKRLDSRSRTLRRPVCVPQMPGRDADDEQLFSTTTFNWPRSSRAAIAIQASPAPTVPAPCLTAFSTSGCNRKEIGRAHV